MPTNQDDQETELIVLSEHADTLPSTYIASQRPLPSTQAAELLEGESLQEVMENYIRYYAVGDSHTARAKRYDLNHFLDYLTSRYKLKSNLVKVSDWTLQATQDFINDRLSIGESPATVARRLATVKHFGRTLAERVHGYINPAREVKSPVLQPTRPHGLSLEDIALLKEAAALDVERKEGNFQSLRNKFLLELLLATGLRADEVRLLTMGQISDDREWLRNVKTKGRKFRNVYLDSAIRIEMENYLELRTKEILEKAPNLTHAPQNFLVKLPVIVSLYRISPENPSTFGLAPKTIWRIIADLGKAAQALSPTRIGNLHPHRLRHTFAHGLLDSSKDVRLVAQALGHSDVRTTMRYTERTEEEIARAIEEKLRSTSS